MSRAVSQEGDNLSQPFAVVCGHFCTCLWSFAVICGLQADPYVPLYSFTSAWLGFILIIAPQFGHHIEKET